MLYILDQLFDINPPSSGKAEVDAKTLFAYTGVKKVITNPSCYLEMQVDKSP